ncbi:MAG: hypothetical protein WDZ60_09645, partial [Wenzhouxiangellaceae bacterium]
MQSVNGEQAIVARARNVTASGFEAAFFEEEALNDGHREEEVGYLAVYSGAGGGQATVAGLPVSYSVSTEQIDNGWTSAGGIQLHLDE